MRNEHKDTWADVRQDGLSKLTWQPASLKITPSSHNKPSNVITNRMDGW